MFKFSANLSDNFAFFITEKGIIGSDCPYLLTCSRGYSFVGGLGESYRLGDLQDHAPVFPCPHTWAPPNEIPSSINLGSFKALDLIHMSWGQKTPSRTGKHAWAPELWWSQQKHFTVHSGKGKAHADIDSNVTTGCVCQ